MTDGRYLGICILIASGVTAAALMFVGIAVLKHGDTGRYQFHPSPVPSGVIWILDTKTGKVSPP